MLIACPACGCHVFESESSCVHCGGKLHRSSPTARRVAIAATILGLSAAMPGCGDDEPSDAYGAPSTGAGGSAGGGAGGAGGTSSGGAGASSDGGSGGDAGGEGGAGGSGGGGGNGGTGG